MTSNASPGSRILGSLRSADGKGIVRVEDRYSTDIERCDADARWHELLPAYQDLAASVG